MSLTICGTTAFKYHRVPPQILGLYPPLPDTFEDPNHLKLAASPIVDLLGTPLHRLIDSKNQYRQPNLYVSRTVNNKLPFGSIYETDHNFDVTSPLATLLTMAGDVSRIHLLMALYEMTGTFSVFKPSKEAVESLGCVPRYARGGWQNVASTNGSATNLWKRPALIDIAELAPFCEQASGFHGIKDLRWAAENLAGVCASPLEVEAAMLLGLPRSVGGEGLDIECNKRIQLSPAARSIYPHTCCYADILIEGNGDNAGVIVECQGKAVHDSDEAWSSDSDRATALTCMGYEVILLTHGQLTNPRTYEIVVDLITHKAGIDRRPKTSRQQIAESDLRANLFIDWTTLGVKVDDSSTNKKRRKTGALARIAK